MQQKPRLSFWQIWNMSFGFLGIQFGWGLQLANMSAIYTYLGASADDVPILWLAGPVTGLLVQPVVGSMSDRTWNRLGRRRPYFLVGAILASIMLFFMPDAAAMANALGAPFASFARGLFGVAAGVAVAAGLLWMLDASINISMEPFRAFVADKLNASQRTAGFVMQSFFIGVGQTLANALVYYFNAAGYDANVAPGVVPPSVTLAFKIGAVVFVLAVLWTVVTTREYPPDDMEAFERMRREKRGVVAGFKEILSAVGSIPATMKQLAVVQFFTWLGLFCMWMFFGLMTSYHVFDAPDRDSALFREGGAWGGLMFAVYSITCFVIAFALPKLAAATSRKAVHAVALTCGGLGLLSCYFIQDKNLLILTMVGVGIAWASILSMPYAILSTALPPARMGVYMGVFNFFIVIPEIIASFTFGRIIRAFFGENSTAAPLYVVMAGGGFLLLAALACVVLVREPAERDVPERAVIEADEHTPLTTPISAQPVPSTGLVDDEPKR